MNTKRIRLLIAAAIVAAAFIYLVIGGLRGSIVYYVTPAELNAQGEDAKGKSIRLGGQVKSGSKQWNATTLELRFVLTDGSISIPVHYRGAPPDLFTEGQGAVVEGALAQSGVFEARSIIVKHSEEYKPPADGR